MVGDCRRMNIRVEAAINPTEDPEKVRRAILNLFPDAKSVGEDTGMLSRRSGTLPGTYSSNLSARRQYYSI